MPHRKRSDLAWGMLCIESMLRSKSHGLRVFVQISALVATIASAACAEDTAQGGAGTAGVSGCGGDAASGGAAVSGATGGHGGWGDACAHGGSTPQWGLRLGLRHLTTGVAPESTILLSGPSPGPTISDTVKDTLESARLIRSVDGVVIESTVTLVVNPYCDREATVALTLAPTEPLDEGWYQFVIEGSFEGGAAPVDMPVVATDRYVSAFRVGSAPFVTKVIELSFDAATVQTSEPVIMPALVPITKALPGERGSACARNVPYDATPIGSVYLLCAETSPDARDYVFAEGIVSPSGVPLRNVAGDTTFRITVPAEDPQGLSSRTWEAVDVPTF